MSFGNARVESREMKTMPAPPTPFEQDLVRIALIDGSPLRNQPLIKFGILEIGIPGDSLAQRDYRTVRLWVPELLGFKGQAVQVERQAGRPTIQIPAYAETPSQEVATETVRYGVETRHLKDVTVSREGFAFSKGDLIFPLGVERPLGQTLARGMRSGEVTDFLAGYSYVWAGEEYANQQFLRVPFGGNDGRFYRDAILIGIGDAQGRDLVKIYPSRMVQVVKDSSVV